MNIGAVIIAQNNRLIDYTKLAVFSGKRIKEYLDIPVSLITDNVKWLEEAYPNHPFEHVLEIPFYDIFSMKEYNDGAFSSSTQEWKNLSRPKVYDLSPYDKTLVIDSDYIISSTNLKNALSLDYHLQIYKNSLDLAYLRNTGEFDRINCYSIPFYWATTFIFQKNLVTESFFNLISYIQKNWLYFRSLYNIHTPAFRNDFAFSIAIHIMNGKTNGEFATELPGKMNFLLDKDFLVSIENDRIKFLASKKDHYGEYVLGSTKGLDVHVMNKQSLSRVIDGGLGV